MAIPIENVDDDVSTFYTDTGMWQIVSGLYAHRDKDPQVLLPVRRVAVHSYDMARAVLNQCLVVDKLSGKRPSMERRFGIGAATELRFDDPDLGITFVYCLLPVANILKTTLRTEIATRAPWTIGSRRDTETICTRAGRDCDIIDCTKCK